MTDALLLGLIVAVAVYGGMILDRLPKPKRHKDYTFEACDPRVTFRIEPSLKMTSLSQIHR